MINKDRVLEVMDSYCRNHNNWEFHSDVSAMVISLDELDAALVGIATDSDFRWYTFYSDLKWYPYSTHSYKDLTEENLDNFSKNGQFCEPLEKGDIKLLLPLSRGNI